MRFSFVLGLCLAFAFVVSSFDEEDFIEDEEENDARGMDKRWFLNDVS